MRYTVLFLVLFFNHSYSQIWEWVNPKPTGYDYNDVELFSADEILFATVTKLLVRTTDRGINWTLEKTPGDTIVFREFDRMGNALYAQCSGPKRLHLLHSSDHGKSFRNITDVLEDSITILSQQALSEQIIFLHGYSSRGFYLLKSFDSGISWSSVPCPFTNTKYRRIAFYDTLRGMISGPASSDGCVYYTTNGGTTWTLSQPTIARQAPMVPLIWTDSTNAWGHYLGGNQTALCKTTDGGRTWSELTSTSGDIADIVILENGNLVISSKEGDHNVYLSMNGGHTWSIVYRDSYPLKSLSRADFCDSLHGCIAGAQGLMLITADGGMTWDELEKGYYFDWTHIKFYDDLHGTLIGRDRKRKSRATTLTTTNGGINWTRADHQLFDESFYASAIAYSHSNHITIAGSVDRKDQQDPLLIFSTDSGVTWSPRYAYPGIDSSVIKSFSINCIAQDTIFAITNNGLLYSSDRGNIWSSKQSPIDSLKLSIAVERHIEFLNAREGLLHIFFDGDRSEFRSSIYQTKDGGISWKLLMRRNCSIDTVTRIMTGYLVSCVRSTAPSTYWILLSGKTGSPADSLITSSDGGSTWQAYPLPFRIGSGEWQLFFVDSSYCGYKEFRSTDGGKTWTRYIGFNELKGLTDYVVSFPSRNVGYVALYTGGIMKTTTGGVNETERLFEVEKNFSLSQNYPNPASASSQTTISYTLEAPNSRVTLAIYDLMGREVQRVIDEEKEQGSHTAHIDASRLPAGVYFYRLFVNGAVTTRKMVVMK